MNSELMVTALASMLCVFIVAMAAAYWCARLSAHIRLVSRKKDDRIRELEGFIRRYRYRIGGQHQQAIDRLLGEPCAHDRHGSVAK